MPVTMRFIDQIPATQTTRLDLNDGTTWTLLAEGTDLSPPGLRRAVVDSGVVRDGSHIPASAYDNRVVTLHLLLTAASQDALATQIQTLNRELNRERNILKYQPDGATKAVYFRTLRSPDYVLDVSSPGVGAAARAFLTVPILAEPFAYGERENPVNAATIDNDMAGANNPHFIDMTGIKGDVLTPALLKIARTGSGDLGWMAIAIRRHGTPSNVTFFNQAESMTQGAETTTQPNDAAMSGSGNNFSRTAFSANNVMVQRLSYDFSPAPAVADTKGTYRVFVRLRTSAAISTGDIQVRLARSGTEDWLGPLTDVHAAANNRLWADLGVFAIPMLTQAPESVGYDGAIPKVANNTLGLFAQRTTGTANLDWDYCALLPADENLAIVEVGTPGFGNQVMLDGPNNSAYWAVSGTPWGDLRAAEGSLSWSGSFPELAPNQTNRLFLLAARAATPEGPDDPQVGDDITLSVFYWPRYLYVQPV